MKGFAFTLGLTTVIDVLIFILFTHPVLQLLARTKFFGSGHPLSGLDPDALGAVYRGRAQFRAPSPYATTAAGARRSRAVRRERRQTIAERKQAELTVGAGDSRRTATRTPSTSKDGKEPDALHEPGRQRPLHRQDLVPLRRRAAACGSSSRRILVIGSALVPLVSGRSSSRSSSPADRSSPSRASATPRPAAGDGRRALRRPRRDDQGHDRRQRHRSACRPTR